MNEKIRIKVEITKLSFWKSLKTSFGLIFKGRFKWVNEEIRDIPLREGEEWWSLAQIEVAWITHHRAIYIAPDWASKD